MHHTLQEFLDKYNPNFIQLVIGDHLVNIDTFAEGSMYIIRSFRNSKFYFKAFNNNLLILSIVD